MPVSSMSRCAPSPGGCADHTIHAASDLGWHAAGSSHSQLCARRSSITPDSHKRPFIPLLLVGFGWYLSAPAQRLRVFHDYALALLPDDPHRSSSIAHCSRLGPVCGARCMGGSPRPRAARSLALPRIVLTSRRPPRRSCAQGAERGWVFCNEGRAARCAAVHPSTDGVAWGGRRRRARRRPTRRGKRHQAIAGFFLRRHR